MARRKIGKLREVKVDIANYSYLINGIGGIGKTTTVTEIGVKKYGVDGYLLLTVGQEPQPEHIGNIYNERVVDWDDLEEVIDTICEYRDEDYPNLRIVGIDSVDEVFRLAERKVIEMHNRKYPDKRTDTIKSAFGGFQAGENKVVDMVVSTLFRLRDYNICPWFIGHTKTKNKVDQILDIEFEQITSNLDSKYYNAIKDKVAVVMCAYMEREMVDLKTAKDAFTKKNKQIGKIASEKRMVTFRDEEYAIDVKSHLKHITPKCELNSDTIIEELEKAIRKQSEMFHGEKTEQEIEEKKIEQVKQQIEESIYIPKSNELEIKTEKLDKIKANIQRLDMTKVQPIMSKYNVIDFTNIEIIDMKCLDEILELL